MNPTNPLFQQPTQNIDRVSERMWKLFSENYVTANSNAFRMASVLGNLRYRTSSPEKDTKIDGEREIERERRRERVSERNEEGNVIKLSKLAHFQETSMN